MYVLNGLRKFRIYIKSKWLVDVVGPDRAGPANSEWDLQIHVICDAN